MCVCVLCALLIFSSPPLVLAALSVPSWPGRECGTLEGKRGGRGGGDGGTLLVRLSE